MKAMQQHGPDYALSDTGRSEHAGPYSCEIWQLSRNGRHLDRVLRGLEGQPSRGR